jgi:hypothetical protein
MVGYDQLGRCQMQKHTYWKLLYGQVIFKGL